MGDKRPKTVGALREIGYTPRPVRDEMRANLIRRLRSGDTLFPGIVGYEDTVTPQIVNAVLARHDFILLGLRGQAKSRILRQLVDLLDEEVPILAGSEVNDDPLAPISKHGRLLLEEHGDDAAVEWIHRDNRYVEKLATPDVTIADIIGDVDPIKAARGGHILADELTIHYGLLPRANRGIFAINELPDLAGKIQVGLFNILQEGDVQIKGYPIQEAWTDRTEMPVEIPEFIAHVVEQVAFLARKDKRVDQRSGVSQRMPITVMEAVVSNAERRALRLGEDTAVPRVGDVYGALPSITGKMELEYEGELQGSESIARELIAGASLHVFNSRAGGADVEEIVAYFEEGGALQVSGDSSAGACVQAFELVPDLLELVEQVGLAGAAAGDGVRAAAAELVLEALVAERRLSRSEMGGYKRPPHEPLAGGNLDFDAFGN
jgi:magnesium chelatase subunit I